MQNETLKLVVGPLSMFSMKAIIAVREKGIAHILEYAPFHPVSRYSPLHPIVEANNPKKQVPVLLDGDVLVYDSTQIFEYLEDRYPGPALWPQSPADRVVARRLELEADEVLFPPVMELIKARYGASVDREEQMTRFRHALRGFNERLQSAPFLAGSFSYADIALVAVLYFAVVLGVEIPSDLAALQAWKDRMLLRQPVADSIAEVNRYLVSIGGAVPEAFATA